MRRPPNALRVLGDRLETGRIVLYGSGVGLLVGVAGTAFLWLLDVAQATLLLGVSGYHPPGLPAEGGVLHAFPGDRRWLLPALLALGLAAAGLLERFASARGNPVEARGNGLDAALAGYHDGRARLNWREALARAAAGVAALGTGAPLGREGPVSVVAAGLGALFGRWGRLSEEDRRLVFVAGLAAGFGIVLRAPLAGAVLAVEILYRRFEFEYEALTPAVLASVVAYAVHGVFRGFEPLFDLPQLGAQPAALLPAFFLLGLIEAGAATAFVAAYRGLSLAWLRLRVPAWARLAVAGLVAGGIAMFVPEVLGEGLGWTQLSLSNFLPAASLAVLLAWRALVVLLVASPGGAGGLVGPSLVLGGLVGSLFALVLGALFPGVALDPAAFTLTGMAAFLAGTVNAPLAATLLVTEWTGYVLLIPLLLTTAAGYVLTGRESVLRGQAESRSSSPVHVEEYLRGAVRLAGGSVAAPAPGATDEATARAPAPENEVPDLLDLLVAGESLPVSDADTERLYRTRAPGAWVGQAVRDLEWPAETLLVAILRDGRVMVPRGATVLEEGDELVVMAEPDSYARFTADRAPAGPAA